MSTGRDISLNDFPNKTKTAHEFSHLNERVIKHCTRNDLGKHREAET